MPVIFPRGGGPGCGCGCGGCGRGHGSGGDLRGSDSSPIFAGCEGATGKKKKMRKSSNNQDSCFCGVVVRMSSSLHATTTQAQAVPAAAAAPAVLAVTSIATAPAAASDAAVTAFTEYDNYIEFDNVIDDGGWGAYGNKVMGESSGRFRLTSQHNNTTTAHAASTTRVLQDQGGYDNNSDIMEVFTAPPDGTVKGNLPLGFVRILDNIKLCILSRLDVNSLAANINAFGKSTLKGMIDDIVEARDSLLLYAEQVDTICRDMLDDSIPN
jgi:hypothetical protein